MKPSIQSAATETSERAKDTKNTTSVCSYLNNEPTGREVLFCNPPPRLELALDSLLWF